jgi:hypothetical protein
MACAIRSYRAVNWRRLTIGSTVWAPWAGNYNIPAQFWPRGWRPAIVTALGKNRRADTVISLHFEGGVTCHNYRLGNGKRYARDLCGRKPGLHGKDKPPTA